MTTFYLPIILYTLMHKKAYYTARILRVKEHSLFDCNNLVVAIQIRTNNGIVKL